MATQREIEAVRDVLYNRQRVRQLFQHMESIEILMNFDRGRALSPNDPRVEAGAGPTWFIPRTGQINSAVKDAIERCEDIARILMRIHAGLGDLNIDRSDRRHLREGFEQQAKAWRRRAAVWRDPDRPNARAAADSIMDHERRSRRELQFVKQYLRPVRPR